jgi:16S rRNA processing protein RimM
MLRPGDWVPLAVVARPHGVKGELRLKLYNEDSDVLLGQDEVLVRLPDGGDSHEVSVDFARRANDAILMKLHSVDDRDRADDLRGAEICVKRESFPALEPGEFYACDVKGARAVLADGTELGIVQDMIEYPASMVLLVKGAQTWEIPLVEAWVSEVDVAAGIVRIASMEALEPLDKKPKVETEKTEA